MATLEDLQARRQRYIDAETKILTGQEYTISDGTTNRRLRRADLEQVRQAIRDIDAEIAVLSPPAVTRRILRIVPGC